MFQKYLLNHNLSITDCKLQCCVLPTKSPTVLYSNIVLKEFWQLRGDKNIRHVSLPKKVFKWLHKSTLIINIILFWLLLVYPSVTEGYFFFTDRALHMVQLFTDLTLGLSCFKKHWPTAVTKPNKAMLPFHVLHLNT